MRTLAAVAVAQCSERGAMLYYRQRVQAFEAAQYAVGNLGLVVRCAVRLSVTQ